MKIQGASTIIKSFIIEYMGDIFVGPHLNARHIYLNRNYI